MSTDPRPRLRTFLARFFQNYQLRDGEDLFKTGYLNSMFAMELVRFVEREFGITVENEDLELANFQSIDALTSLITRKQGGRTS